MATEAQLAREWAGVAGAAFALMGASLAGRAAAHARENLVWQRQWRQAVGSPAAAEDDGEARRLAAAYRAAGAAFAGAGLLLLGAALLRPDALASWHRPASIGRAGAAAGGLLLSVAGFGTAWSRLLLVERVPAAVRAVLPAERPPFGERLARACGWALSFLLSAYGLRLLREALR
ncbi:MAG: hypothetical protein SF051_03670 [Elusimicrobiota bacterium]|nr:hypothetical protein [Elusimicrobiota bacterium]